MSRKPTRPSTKERQTEDEDAQDPGWFLLDSGNLDLLVVAPHLSGGGAVAAVHQVAFTVEGLTPKTIDARTKALVIDGVIPESFMRQYVWTCDLAASSVWARAKRQAAAPVVCHAR